MSVTSCKFESVQANPEQMKNMSAGLVIGILMIFAGIVVMLVSMSRPNTIEIQDGSLVISGSYGMTLPTEEIKTVELLDTLPKITIRTNGIALGDTMIGHFRMKEIGSCRLHLNTGFPPFVHIVTKEGKHIFFNTKDAARTRELFDSLNKKPF